MVRHVAEPILLLAHERSRRVCWPRTLRSTTTRPAANYDPERSDLVVQDDRHRQGRPRDRGLAAARRHRRGRVPRRSSGAALHRAERRRRGAGERRRHGVRLAAVSLLRAPRADRAARLPPEKVRVVQTETGGGFGGKEEYPSMIAGHAALVALKSGRPVKLVYDRVEDMLATTKRHPAIVRHRTGVKKDGRLTAMDIDVVLDGGAYATLSAVVLSRGMIHASGPYRCDHVRVQGPRDDDQHAAERRISRLRRAADAVRRRSAHGSDRRAARHRSGAAARAQCAPARRHDGDRAEGRQGLQRARGAARGGTPHELLEAAAGARRDRIAASACRCSSTAPASPAAAR